MRVVEPRPYTLVDRRSRRHVDLGVRAAYDTDDEVRQVAERTGMRLRRRTRDA